MDAIIEVAGLTHRYGRTMALRDVGLRVPRGALYALLGPNGAGKTTLLQGLMGLQAPGLGWVTKKRAGPEALRPTGGRVTVLGRELAHLTRDDRTRIGYVAEGQKLPGWMTMDRLEAFLAPLYPGWGRALASELRHRFRLPGRRRIDAMSRGEQMKAALPCALAPRPDLLVMDEPFTGMDALVKDELVRGLLASVTAHSCSVVLSSQDVGELEPLADWVGFLDRGRLILSEPMDVLRERFKRVEVMGTGGSCSPVRGCGRGALGARGVAYFDSHRVRTLPEVLMIVIGPDDRISRIETVAFREPPEYEAPEGWLDLFGDRGLDEDLSEKGRIPNITGATLTAEAVTRAAQRTLALHRVIDPFR